MPTNLQAELGGDLQQYLVASYCYYIVDKPVMADEEYDALAKKLLKNWGKFKHPHKHLVKPEDLKAGTLYSLKADDYPGMVKGAAEMAMAKKYGCACPVIFRATGLPKGREGYKCYTCGTTYTWRKQ